MPNSLKSRLKKLVNQGLLSEKDLSRIVVISDNMTRKELHKAIFGVDPPELDSPYCSCAIIKGCENCKHKDDLNCDVNWWNAPYKKGK